MLALFEPDPTLRRFFHRRGRFFVAAAVRFVRYCLKFNVATVVLKLRHAAAFEPFLKANGAPGALG